MDIVSKETLSTPPPLPKVFKLHKQCETQKHHAGHTNHLQPIILSSDSDLRLMLNSLSFCVLPGNRDLPYLFWASGRISHLISLIAEIALIMVSHWTHTCNIYWGLQSPRWPFWAIFTISFPCNFIVKEIRALSVPRIFLKCLLSY